MKSLILVHIHKQKQLTHTTNSQTRIHTWRQTIQNSLKDCFGAKLNLQVYAYTRLHFTPAKFSLYIILG